MRLEKCMQVKCKAVYVSLYYTVSSVCVYCIISMRNQSSSLQLHPEGCFCLLLLASQPWMGTQLLHALCIWSHRHVDEDLLFLLVALLGSAWRHAVVTVWYKACISSSYSINTQRSVTSGFENNQTLTCPVCSTNLTWFKKKKVTTNGEESVTCRTSTTKTQRRSICILNVLYVLHFSCTGPSAWAAGPGNASCTRPGVKLRMQQAVGLGTLRCAC